jgi:hypothetical protein
MTTFLQEAALNYRVEPDRCTQVCRECSICKQPKKQPSNDDAIWSLKAKDMFYHNILDNYHPSEKVARCVVDSLVERNFIPGNVHKDDIQLLIVACQSQISNNQYTGPSGGYLVNKPVVNKPVVNKPVDTHKESGFVPTNPEKIVLALAIILIIAGAVRYMKKRI